MSSWSEKHEATKQFILKHLSGADKVARGEPIRGIEYALRDVVGRPLASSNTTVRDRLSEMLADGLIEVVGEHPAHGNIRKSFRITEKGRDHLAEATNKARPGGEVEERPEPSQWAARVTSSRLEQDAAAFIRQLPEFQGSDEARIQEVSRGLVEAIGVPSSQMPHSDVKRPGR